MIRMAVNLTGMDWASWTKGLFRALISGGAGAVASGFGDIAVESLHPTGHTANLSHTFYLMGATFLLTGGFRLAEYLQYHPIPDDIPKLQRTLDAAADATAQAGAAISSAQSQTK
jgi:hypothetical protein